MQIIHRLLVSEIETNLRTCNLQTSQLISYKSVKQFQLNLPPQMVKKNVQSAYGREILSILTVICWGKIDFFQ